LVDVSVWCRVPRSICVLAVTPRGPRRRPLVRVLQPAPVRPTAPSGCGRAGSGSSRFDLDLDLVPAWVDRLVLTAAIDGGATMGSLSSGHLVVAGWGR
jgi:hypothetical protein